jgi:hypothetical protein
MPHHSRAHRIWATAQGETGARPGALQKEPHYHPPTRVSAFPSCLFGRHPAARTPHKSREIGGKLTKIPCFAALPAASVGTGVKRNVLKRAPPAMPDCATPSYHQAATQRVEPVPCKRSPPCTAITSSGVPPFACLKNRTRKIMESQNRHHTRQDPP